MVGEIANFLQCTMASIKYHLISFIEYTYSMIVEHFSENMQSKHWNIIWINKREMKNVPRIEHLILVWFSRINVLCYCYCFLLNRSIFSIIILFLKMEKELSIKNVEFYAFSMTAIKCGLSHVNVCDQINVKILNRSRNFIS